MKNKYTLMKILLVLLVFVIAGVIYSCASSLKKEVTVDESSQASSQESTSETSAESTTYLQQTESETEANICVHVCGAVVSPGVYYLQEGARVHQAVEMAGGLKSDAAEEYVNLADVLTDGMQIYIPSEEEVEKSGDYTIPTSSSASSQTDDLVNINTADAAELETLPGIGESRAQAIISYRENVSSFQTTEDILNVSGVGESLYEKIKNYIKV